MLPPELGIEPIELMGEDINPFTDRHVWAPSRVPDLSNWVCPYLTDPNDDDRDTDEDGVPILAAEVRKHGVCTTYSETLTEVPLDRVHYIGQARPAKVIDIAAAMEGRRKMIDNTIGTVMSRGECWESHNPPEGGTYEIPDLDEDGCLAQAQTESVWLASASEHFDARTAALLDTWRDAGNPDEMPRPQPGRAGSGGASTHAGARTHGAGDGGTGGRGQWLQGWNKPAMAAEVVLLVLVLWWLL